jgi:hypothetical protein
VFVEDFPAVVQEGLVGDAAGVGFVIGHLSLVNSHLSLQGEWGRTGWFIEREGGCAWEGGLQIEKCKLQIANLD